MKTIHWIASVLASISLALTLAVIWTAQGSKAFDLPDRMGWTAFVFGCLAFVALVAGVE